MILQNNMSGHFVQTYLSKPFYVQPLFCHSMLFTFIYLYVLSSLIELLIFCRCCFLFIYYTLFIRRYVRSPFNFKKFKNIKLLKYSYIVYTFLIFLTSPQQYRVGFFKSGAQARQHRCDVTCVHVLNQWGQAFLSGRERVLPWYKGGR